MKAAVWYGKKDVRVMDVPEPPSPPKGWVKVKVQWCGICGSDLHEYIAGPIFIPVDKPHPLTGNTAPLILGHEFSGDVVEIGPDVTNVKVGDRVAPDACQVCWECARCRENRYSLCDKLAFTGLMTDGAFAEYVNVPAYTMYKIPDKMSYEVGAVIEPLAVAMHAIRRAPLVQGDTVVVMGAGTIGLSALMCAKAAGASKIYTIEVAKARKEYALQAGATAVLDPTETDVVKAVKDLTNGGADVVFECIGSDKTAPIAIELARSAGRVVIVGIFEKASTLNFNALSFTEKEVTGSLGYYGEFAPAIQLVSDGRIDVEPLITGKIHLDDIVGKGFEELINRKEENIKILVKPF
ncbi:2,3-butanediol dehydrogenase [Sporomusa acidovorans]|uniref:Zinc-type alcohol dehydrogenase-like protein YdjJ n=1 Tax=Sporomusa acidovorans (strain ATCC 49682 / DSM 3132 / Mol) TaxID=1123286 RepID=A0ABZ3J5V8_SPOA4|nr:2,3-butanediol dehydrogenase [Sporomusa acidovorans]OZC15636.1 sorbitol dehydrogenase [Sporomusa acidovorans DSM 3132]SDE87938.1 (R,R)-butanediol dehydrogenase / meso-butanediol dehydrogenase / diacetyl reductase [Sporomusa acidovorans]